MNKFLNNETDPFPLQFSIIIYRIKSLEEIKNIDVHRKRPEDAKKKIIIDISTLQIEKGNKINSTTTLPSEIEQTLLHLSSHSYPQNIALVLNETAYHALIPLMQDPQHNCGFHIFLSTEDATKFLAGSRSREHLNQN